MNKSDPYTNPFNEWLKSNAVWLVIAVAAILVTVVVVLLVMNVKSKVIKVPKLNCSMSEFVGGKENIISSQLNGSRIVLELKDNSLVDDAKLKENKVLSIIKMSKKITLVCDKSDIEDIFKSFN